MDATLQGLLARYEGLVIEHAQVRGNLLDTLRLLADLKDGRVPLSRLSVAPDGWHIMPEMKGELSADGNAGPIAAAARKNGNPL